MLGFRKLDQTGDTIVEVLIVLAVLGLALSISYATANRSLLNARQGEETAQATRYAQSQIEALRILAPQGTTNTLSPYYVQNPNENIFSQSNTFCIPDASQAVPIVPYTATPAPNCMVNGIYNEQIYNCDVVSSSSVSNECNTNLSSPYAGSDTFLVEITWPDVAGDGSDLVTQVYRVHPSQ